MIIWFFMYQNNLSPQLLFISKYHNKFNLIIREKCRTFKFL